MKQVKGFTLVELLSTFALVGILIAIGIPSLVDWVTRNRVTTLEYTLLHSINYARVQGINRQTTVNLCPGLNQCERDWGSQIIIFLDFNSDGILDLTDQLLKKIDLGNDAGTLDWRSFRRKNYLQFTSEGLTSALNGTLHFCHKKPGKGYDFAIVLARTGRIRVHKEPDC